MTPRFPFGFSFFSGGLIDVFCSFNFIPLWPPLLESLVRGIILYYVGVQRKRQHSRTLEKLINLAEAASSHFGFSMPLRTVSMAIDLGCFLNSARSDSSLLFGSVYFRRYLESLLSLLTQGRISRREKDNHIKYEVSSQGGAILLRYSGIAFPTHGEIMTHRLPHVCFYLFLPFPRAPAVPGIWFETMVSHPGPLAHQ